MPDLPNPKVPQPPGQSAAPPSAPTAQVWVPVTAGDVARRKRRLRLSWTAAAIVVLAAGAWIYKRSTDPARAQQALQAARKLFDGARYDQAIVSCDRATSLKADLVEAYVLRGRSHVALYQAREAIGDFSKAIQLQPRDVEALLQRAQSYLEVKDYKAAIADAQAALAVDPRRSRAHNIWGTALRATGGAQPALAEFTRAVEIEPNEDNLFQRGSTYQLLGDHRRASDDFTRALALDPDLPQVYFARAEAERALGLTKEAEADHKQGRVLDGR